tara:strand:- start:479 stop:739 length:261 start_codon:yes stop_codon:yes gene_type:complete
MYKLKFWLNENSKPELREGITYALAYALATKAGFAKAQVITEDGVIEFETRWEMSGWDDDASYESELMPDRSSYGGEWQPYKSRNR